MGCSEDRGGGALEYVPRGVPRCMLAPYAYFALRRAHNRALLSVSPCLVPRAHVRDQPQSALAGHVVLAATHAVGATVWAATHAVAGLVLRWASPGAASMTASLVFNAVGLPAVLFVSGLMVRAPPPRRAVRLPSGSGSAARVCCAIIMRVSVATAGERLHGAVCHADRRGLHAAAQHGHVARG